MKKDKNLFAEAILDAKSIRETATLNAKLALEEQLTPKLQKMLAKKLQEQEERVVKENEELDENAGSGLDEELNLDEILAELELEENGDASPTLNESVDLDEGEDDETNDEPASEPSDEPADEPDLEMSGEGGEEPISDDDKLNSLTVADLKNILRDIVAQEVGGGESGLGEPGLDDPSLDASPDLGAPGLDEPGVPSGVGDAGLGDDDDVDLDELLAELESMNQNEGLGNVLKKGAGAVKSGFQKAKKFYNNEISPKSVKAGGKYAGKGVKHDTNVFAENQELDEAEELQKENAQLKAHLQEAKNAINVYRKELNEQNLLNAKLLYVNKIFKAKNLNEDQKVKVITTFDKVTSVKDAKLVYEALSATGGKATPKKSITESRGFASKPTGIAPNKPSSIVNDDVERWQYLAGIKKTKY